MHIEKMSTHEITQYLRTERCQALSVWDVEDVLHQAKEDGVLLTEAEAELVIQELDRRHDANEGINWTVISCTIQNMIYFENLKDA